MRQLIMTKIKSFQTILMVLMTLGYLLGSHLSTINSLKMALADKANRSDVELLDKKLTRIEVKLEEAIITRKEFSELRQHIDNRILDLTVRRETVKERKADDGK